VILCVENERLRVEAFRPALGEIATQPPRDPRRRRELAGADQNLAVRERGETAVMIDVHVRQNHPLDVCWADSDRLQLRPGLLIRLDVETHRKAEIRMPARKPLEARGGAGIDKNHAVAMLDRVGVGRQPG
jgi:hypothetical protein